MGGFGICFEWLLVGNLFVLSCGRQATKESERFVGKRISRKEEPRKKKCIGNVIRESRSTTASYNTTLLASNRVVRIPEIHKLFIPRQPNCQPNDQGQQQ